MILKLCPDRAKANVKANFSLICNGVEITFVSEKHVVEDDVLFTNHLAENRKIPAEVVGVLPFCVGRCGSSWL